MAALEWTLTYSTKDFSSVSIAAAGVATAAGKSIDCNTGSGTVTCLISGENDTALGNGTVATATLNISAGAVDASAPVGLSSGSSASTAGELIGTATNGGTVSIAVGMASINSLACNPASVQGPANATCTVGLNGSAPGGGLTASVGYTAGSGVVKSIPSSVTIPAGSSSGSFTASLNSVSAASTVAITARLNSSSASFNLQDEPAGSISVSVSPGSASLGGGQQQQFVAKVSGSSNTGVKWSISPSVGSISSGGLYQAPSKISSAQTVTVTAASAADPSKTGKATVQLTPAGGGGSGAAPALDAKATHDQGWTSNILYSPPFTTKYGNELILAFISTDYLGGANTSVQSIGGAGLTWTRVIQTNAQAGTSEIWRAFATQPLKNASFVATLSQNVVASMTVMTFTGVDPSGTNGSGAIGATGSGNGPHGAPSASLTTSRANSVIVGVGNDYDNPLGRVPDAGQSLVNQWFSTTADTYWVQALNSPVAAAGTRVTVGDSAPASDRYNLSICEVLAAPASGASRTFSASAGAASNNAPAQTAEGLQ